MGQIKTVQRALLVINRKCYAGVAIRDNASDSKTNVMTTVIIMMTTHNSTHARSRVRQ